MGRPERPYDLGVGGAVRQSKVLPAIPLTQAPRNTLRSKALRGTQSGTTWTEVWPALCVKTRPTCGATYSALGRGMCEGPGIPLDHAGLRRQNRRWRWALQKAVGVPSFVTPPAEATGTGWCRSAVQAFPTDHTELRRRDDSAPHIVMTEGPISIAIEGYVMRSDSS